MIWKWKGPPCVQTFLWLVAHGRLLTNAHHICRSMANFGVFSLCNAEVQMVLHVIRDYDKARRVWLQIIAARLR